MTKIDDNRLFRLGGYAAVLGGIARICTTFLPYREGSAALEILYVAIDLLMLFGLIALYARYARSLGPVGLVAFLVAAAGLASIVGPDPVAFGINFYEFGAQVIVSGFALLALALIRAKLLRTAAIFWLVSFVIGLTGALWGASAAFVDSLSGETAHGGLAFMLSGMAFGAGFAAAGVGLLRSIGRAENSPAAPAP